MISPSKVLLEHNVSLPEQYDNDDQYNHSIQPAASAAATTMLGPLSPERERTRRLRILSDNENDMAPLLHSNETSTIPREGQQSVRPTHHQSTGVSGSRYNPYDRHHPSGTGSSASRRGDIPIREVPQPKVPRRVSGIVRRRHEEVRRRQGMAAFA
ncbi:hypothetical protein DMENIID0001_070930 [Sergentomyia squamirostris]